MLITHIIQGLTSFMNVNASPLYRYPYRSAEEAFRGDWKRIGKDIDTALHALEGDRDGR